MIVITKPGHGIHNHRMVGKCHKCGCEFRCHRRDTLEYIGGSRDAKFDATVCCPDLTCCTVVRVTQMGEFDARKLDQKGEFCK
jgi:hypothetical protein